MPPSLRTRQKWMAMKITMTNGNINTWSTYQRNKVLVPISTPPWSTNRAWLPKTGVYVGRESGAADPRAQLAFRSRSLTSRDQVGRAFRVPQEQRPPEP